MLNKLKRSIQNHLGITGINNRLDKIDHVSKIADENYWGLVFNNTITDSKWLAYKSFSPGRWAAGYPFLYILYRVLNDVRPSSIIEFGLGETSKITSQYVKKFTDTELTIIEQDINWLNYFSNEILDVRPYVQLYDIEKAMFKGAEIYQYKDLLSGLGNKKFNLFIVDGPWGSQEYSRYQIVSLFMAGYFQDDFIVLIDDSERHGEKMTILDLKSALETSKIEFWEGTYAGLKNTKVICSKKYQFLVSL